MEKRTGAVKGLGNLCILNNTYVYRYTRYIYVFPFIKVKILLNKTDKSKQYIILSTHSSL